MIDLGEYLAGLEQDPHYKYQNVVGDASVDLLAETQGIEAVVENLKMAERDLALLHAYYHEVVVPELDKNSEGVRIFSGSADGQIEAIPIEDSKLVRDLQKLTVLDNVYLARLASRLVGIADNPNEIRATAANLVEVTEKMEEHFIKEYSAERYEELYFEILAISG